MELGLQMLGESRKALHCAASGSGLCFGRGASMKLDHERFARVGITRLDAKNRVTLGGVFKKSKGITVDAFETFIGESGDILLRPKMLVSIKESWIHQNPEAMKSLQRGIKNVSEKRVVKVKNVDKFLNDL